MGKNYGRNLKVDKIYNTFNDLANSLGVGTMTIENAFFYRDKKGPTYTVKFKTPNKKEAIKNLDLEIKVISGGVVKISKERTIEFLNELKIRL